MGEGGGSGQTPQKVRGGPASADPVSMVMEPQARHSWGLLSIWTWPGTFTEPQLGWVCVGGLLPKPPRPPDDSGPYCRGEVSPARARLLAQGPSLAGASVLAPRVEAFKSEPGQVPELWVVLSDPGAGQQSLFFSLNDDWCPQRLQA